LSQRSDGQRGKIVTQPEENRQNSRKKILPYLKQLPQPEVVPKRPEMGSLKSGGMGLRNGGESSILRGEPEKAFANRTRIGLLGKRQKSRKKSCGRSLRPVYNQKLKEKKATTVWG